MQVRACLSLVYCIEVFDISLRNLTIALAAKDNDGHTLCRNRASQFPDIAPWMMNMTSDPNLLSLLNKTSSDDDNDSDPYQLEFKWTWHKLCHSENLWVLNYQSTSPPVLTYLLSSNWWLQWSDHDSKKKDILAISLISKLPTKMTVIRIMLTTQKMTMIWRRSLTSNNTLRTICMFNTWSCTSSKTSFANCRTNSARTRKLSRSLLWPGPT